MKDKKSKLDDINKKFLAETLNGAKILHFFIHELMKGKLVRDELNGVIQSEKRCDRLKEEYITILFKDKRALPFLVEDRYKIISMLDKINGKGESIARFLRVYPYNEVYQDILEKFKALCDSCLHSVEELVNCTTLIETDFNGAYKKTFEIETLRRNSRKIKFKLLDIVYKKKDDLMKVYLTSKLITYIYEVISWAEEISDYLRSLIIKYPSR